MTQKILTPLKAIRAKCMECCCGQAKEIKLCNLSDCPLFPYRMGKRPKVDKYIDEGDIEEKKHRLASTFLGNMYQISAFFIAPVSGKESAVPSM